MTVGARGDWAFVLAFRAEKLAGLVLVAAAVAIATVLFQTIAENRILTPAVMGFDSLYLAIQTGAVHFLGSRALVALDPRLRFVVETAAMVALSGLLFRWLFLGRRRSIHLVVLAGLVFGLFFRSLSSMVQRMLDPNEFAVVQDMMFASFNKVDTDLLAVAAAAVAGSGIVCLRLVHALDVLALGRDLSVNLGVDHRRLVTALFAVVAILVSVSTALVGPITFFGLLVASLAYQVAGSDRHRETLPAAILIAIVALVGGQTVLERVFGLDTALSVIVDFAGGLAFLVLLLRSARA
ncbi:enterobactin ABC transporter permease [Rhizobiales bacterium L72]|uniref:Enterobactin ABC transporter permease n=2 Tax=Propylenella binzhouense TaxID=2555902 RepID=A0A964T1Q9_9HYPH|nr:enterobactin ABC transporter permease [Propylenella binzhouense]